MKQLEGLARAALGINVQRGDILVVENLSFQEVPAETLPVPTKFEHWRKLAQPWTWTLRYVSLGAMFLAVYWLVLRPVKKQAVEAFRALPGKLAANAERTSGDARDFPLVEGAEGDARRAHQLRRVLNEKIKTEPGAAGRLVQAWVREGGDK